MKTVTISPGTGKTDHYASVMYRVNVEYYTKVVNDQQSIRLILKTMPFIDGAHKDLIEKLDIFEREIDVYSNVLPRMTRMLNEAGVDFNAGAKYTRDNLIINFMLLRALLFDLDASIIH